MSKTKHSIRVKFDNLISSLDLLVKDSFTRATTGILSSDGVAQIIPARWHRPDSLGVHSLEPGSVQHKEDDLPNSRSVQPESSRPEAACTVSPEAVHSLAPASVQRQPERTASPEQTEADPFDLPNPEWKATLPSTR